MHGCTFCRRHRTWSFHVLVLQRAAKECTKIYKERAQLLFFTVDLLFSNVFVAVVVAADLTNAIVMKNVLDGTNPLGII